jgi:HK97 family phage major capsid protein
MPGISMEEVVKTVDDTARAFEAFKAAHKEEALQFAAKGYVDGLLSEKMSKIDTEMLALEAKMVSMAGLLKTSKEQMDAVELAMSRPVVSDADSVKKSNTVWLRAALNAITGASVDDTQATALSGSAIAAKALGISNETAGGYLAPPEFYQQIQMQVNELSPVRNLVSSIAIGTTAIQFPKAVGTLSAYRMSELENSQASTGVSFGLQTITAYKAGGYVDLSAELIADSVFDLETFIRNAIADAFAIQEGSEVVNGAARDSCQGFLTHSGIVVVPSGVSAAITDDSIITLQHSIKSPYTMSGKATFVFCRSTLAALRRLKDGDGRYMWAVGDLKGGIPNTLSGDPYMVIPDMPAIGASAKSIAYGDFKRGYMLVDRASLAILRDPYTQALADTLRLHFRRRFGGQVKDANALAILQCGA